MMKVFATSGGGGGGRNAAPARQGIAARLANAGRNLINRIRGRGVGANFQGRRRG
jgi:hypothetical protein